MFTTSNKLITNCISVSWSTFSWLRLSNNRSSVSSWSTFSWLRLSNSRWLHEPALTHCTAKVSFQVPHDQNATLTDSVTLWIISESALHRSLTMKFITLASTLVLQLRYLRDGFQRPCYTKVPITLKKYVYYAQKMNLSCSRNVPIKLRKCA